MARQLTSQQLIDYVGFIYKVTSLDTKVVYVGQTTSAIKDRWRSHCNLSTSSLYPLIKTYGKDRFTVELLEICYSARELNNAEVRHITNQSKTSILINKELGGRCSPKMETTKRLLQVCRSGKKYKTVIKLRKGVRKTNTKRGVSLQKAVLGTHILTGETIQLASMSQDSRFDPRLISACCRGKRRSHNKFAWKYI